MDIGEPTPWLWLSPPSESLSVEGGGGSLGGVSLGNGGINLQLSSAGSKFKALSATKHDHISKISTALCLKLSTKNFRLHVTEHLTNASNRDEKYLFIPTNFLLISHIYTV